MNGSSIVNALVSLMAVSVVGFAGFYGYGAWVRRGDEPVPRLRRGLFIGLPAVALVAYVVLRMEGVDGVQSYTVETPIWQYALALFSIGLGVATTVLVAYLGLFPHAREARGLDIEVRRAAMKFSRSLGALVLVATLVIPPLGWLNHNFPLLGFPVALCLLAAGFWLASPFLVRVATSTRETSETERNRLQPALDAVGLSVRQIRVLDMQQEEAPVAFVRGPRPIRELYVSNHLLESFDNDELRATLAIQAGTIHERVLGYRIGALLALLVGSLFGLQVAFDIFWLLGILFLLLSPVTVPAAAYLLFRHVQRQVYRADEYAARQVDPGTVADALDHLADERDLSYEGSRLGNLIRMRPALGDRIDRLREQATE